MTTQTTATRPAPKIVETMPAGTQAQILTSVIRSTSLPAMVLPEIAHNHSIPLSALQALLNHHGYPDKTRMGRAAQQLASTSPTAPTNQAPPGVPAGPVMRRVPLVDLHPDPNNLRVTDKTDIDDLAASIQANGLLQPIVARADDTGRLIVVAGPPPPRRTPPTPVDRRRRRHPPTHA